MILAVSAGDRLRRNIDYPLLVVRLSEFVGALVHRRPRRYDSSEGFAVITNFSTRSKQ